MLLNGTWDMKHKLKIRWNYEITELPDHMFMPVLKICRRLEAITGLQVTSSDLIGRESEIPFPVESAHELDDASGDLVVNLIVIDGYKK